MKKITRYITLTGDTETKFIRFDAMGNRGEFQRLLRQPGLSYVPGPWGLGNLGPAMALAAKDAILVAERHPGGASEKADAAQKEWRSVMQFFLDENRPEEGKQHLTRVLKQRVKGWLTPDPSWDYEPILDRL